MSEYFSDAARRAARLASVNLGWIPDNFWRATPAELRTALGLDVETVVGLERTVLQKLMEVFPDG